MDATCSPARADMVAALGETTGDSIATLSWQPAFAKLCISTLLRCTGVAALQGMLRRMQDSETGQQILRDKPRVTVSELYNL